MLILFMEAGQELFTFTISFGKVFPLARAKNDRSNWRVDFKNLE